MPNKRTTVYLTGRIFWAKIFGDPRPNYDGDANEWTFEFEPDEEGTALLKEHGLGDRIKDKSGKEGYEGRGPYVVLRQKEFNYKGEPNKHIRVLDANNDVWPDGVMIGNKTEADVKLTVVNYGKGKKSGMYPAAIRVLELVPFVANDFAPLPKDDERRKNVPARQQEEQLAEDFGTKPSKPTPEKINLIPEDDLDDDPVF